MLQPGAGCFLVLGLSIFADLIPSSSQGALILLRFPERKSRSPLCVVSVTSIVPYVVVMWLCAVRVLESFAEYDTCKAVCLNAA